MTLALRRVVLLAERSILPRGWYAGNLNRHVLLEKEGLRVCNACVHSSSLACSCLPPQSSHKPPWKR